VCWGLRHGWDDRLEQDQTGLVGNRQGRDRVGVHVGLQNAFMSGGHSGPGRHAHGMEGGQVGNQALWIGGPGGSHGVAPVGGCSADPGRRACSMGEHESHDVVGHRAH
jgi:hypothetical protein